MDIKDTDRRWVRPKEGYVRLGCGHDKFYQLLKSGRFETKKIDGMRLIWLPSILALGDSQQKPATGPAVVRGGR